MSDKMDNAIVHAKIVGHNNENPLKAPNKDFESSKEDCSSEIMSREVKPGDVLPSSLKKLQVGDFCTQKLFLQQMSGLKKRIPKQIMSLEEKYLRHCLELIHMSAMRANSWPMPSKVNFLPDGFSSRVVGGGSACDALFLFSSGAENVVISSSMDPIVGSITGSTSMINLLSSPLLRQLGASDDDVNYGNTSTIDVREPLSSVGISSLGGLSLGSSQDLQKKRVVPEDQIFGSEPVHKRLVSLSSTNSTFSDPSSSSSSSSSSSAYCQGMLHCSWNNGFPRYVFSVEDQREVYTTNLSKVESLRDEGLDYIYMFHSRAGKSENEIHDEESDLVGKMRVSTSFTLCPFRTEVMETQFSLYATGHHSEGGIHTSNQMVRKNKGISKKVANIFRGNHSYRQRTSSKFDGSFIIQDNLLEPSKEGDVLLESSFPSNLELAAIVVKDHIPCSQKKVEVGGWGLKFLKEDGHRKTNASPATQSVPCEPCHRCSSMDVLVPADFHGGPKTKSGGPSSLVERWRSGGSCDCGGWDIGCPLTVLNTGPNNKDDLYQAGVFGKSNSFELFTKGCKQSMPVIEVKNVHDGLYYIQYQSTLSALQSLAIVVAIIHSHSPTLKPKVYRN
ncbi:hypothetical protein L6452_23768 [Arctium lappa]|uniref:Uncharacterized protein n=1 Tax=Arctium lappa TaxID=4217 RepID=A0ACB9A8S1_ARCLA|nr:hypothetical protein L6452_23768 [Arctium lappa]